MVCARVAKIGKGRRPVSLVPVQRMCVGLTRLCWDTAAEVAARNQHTHGTRARTRVKSNNCGQCTGAHVEHANNSVCTAAHVS
jgi:hypothetical protein